MNTELGQKLDEIPRLSRKDLRELWQKAFGKPSHPKLRREVMIPILIYRVQEQALGGLKPSTEKRLRALAQELAQGKTSGPGAPTRLRPGTRIVREWRDKLHEVVVLEQGFEYQGRTFRSLSDIATTITGTRWSGPAFFGLKKKAAA